MTQTPAGGAARTVSYAYDPTTGDLDGLTDWNAQTTSYQFTDDGRLYAVDRPNGDDTLHNYDAAGRLTAISHLDAAQQPLAEYGYVLDANSNRVRLDVTGSAVTNGVEEYTYDELDRLTTATYPGGGSATYAYDANGNRSSVTSGGQTTNYVYDAADQLQELRDGGGALLVDLGYDGNGNRVSANADTYVYDWANRLTQATVGGTSSSFAYLADGTRATKTSGATTPYLYDRAAGLPVVVDDGASGYVHGPAGLLEEVGASTTWALGDGLGSVRARANAAGAAIGTADWDAFGNVRTQTGTGGAFGWAGEQRDAETGLTYLRSRYYSPGVGRFLSADVLSQSDEGTQGFNRYAYAGNNPETYADPSGHAIAEVFWYIAAVLDCYLVGECRYQRRHGTGESGLVGIGRSDNLFEFGFPGDDWPGVPEPDRPWDPQLPDADDFPGESAGSLLCRWENIFCGPGGGRGQGGGGRGGGGVFRAVPRPHLPFPQSSLPNGGPRPYVAPRQAGNPEVVPAPGGQRGYVDARGNVWQWDRSQHGGPHWDVQHPKGGHTNVDPSGHVIGGPARDNFPYPP